MKNKHTDEINKLSDLKWQVRSWTQNSNPFTLAVDSISYLVHYSDSWITQKNTKEYELTENEREYH